MAAYARPPKETTTTRLIIPNPKHREASQNHFHFPRTSLEEAEFDTIFEDKGVLVQPAPTNKQTANSIIKEFVSNPNVHMFHPNN